MKWWGLGVDAVLAWLGFTECSNSVHSTEVNEGIGTECSPPAIWSPGRTGNMPHLVGRRQQGEFGGKLTEKSLFEIKVKPLLSCGAVCMGLEGVVQVSLSSIQV